LAVLVVIISRIAGKELETKGGKVETHFH